MLGGRGAQSRMEGDPTAFGGGAWRRRYGWAVDAQGGLPKVTDAGGISDLDQALAGGWSELVKLMGDTGSGSDSISIARRRNAMF